MDREKFEMDCYDLMQLLVDFLGESGSVVLDGYYPPPEEGSSNREMAKHFADYVSTWFYDRGVESPLYFLSKFRELSAEAVQLEMCDPQLRRTIAPTKDELQAKQGLLNLCSSQIGDLIPTGQLHYVQRYINACHKIHDRSAQMTEINEAVHAHYQHRRAESLSVISAPKLRSLIMERDGAKCRWCDETEGLALDHVLPVSAGGTDDPENLQLLCCSCNSSKGDRVPSQFKERTEA